MKTNIYGLGTPEPIPATNFALSAPGMSGTVDTLAPGEAASRAATRNYIERAAAAHVEAGTPVAVVGQLALDLRIRPSVAGETRGETVGLPTLHVNIRDESTGYALLYVDEATGVSRWVLDGRREDTASQKRLAFELPQVVDGGTIRPEQSGSRGLITGAMRALVKVVAWVTDPVVGAAAYAIAKAWEDRRRPYCLRQITAEGKFVDPDWKIFTDEPTLLLVHGTFSTAAAGFYGWLGGPEFAAVHARYGGRCLAFAHPTMYADPDDNIEWLFNTLPADKVWTFDAVSHSRGGLILRALAAKAGVKNNCKVARIVMVAPPNFGTPLADAKHWIAFLNAHTNLLVTAPDTVSTIVAEGILCLVKILGSGVAKNLPGLAAMNLAADYLSALARRPIGNVDQMFVVACDYSPINHGALKRLLAGAGDAVVDRFFDEANDLVVPTLGCSEGSLASAGFPIPVERLTKLSGGTHHLNVFENADVQKKLSTWLG